MSLTSSGVVDFEALTGQSRFVIDLLTIPFFSAFAGWITNWTGVIMLFAPLRFSGMRLPGVDLLFRAMPRRVQVLPCWAPGGVIGFQGMIPSRAEKLASLSVDLGLGKVGTMEDFFEQLDPEALGEYFAKLALPRLRPIVDDIMAREYPGAWAALPPQAREFVYRRVEQRLPDISRSIMREIGANISKLIDLKLMVVQHMRRYPEVLKDIIWELGRPELRFMVRIGPELGFPMGIGLALLLHFASSIPLINLIPAWMLVVGGAAVVGVIVNIIAVKVVFEPGTPQPRWRYPWKQAKFAKRHHEAAASYGAAIAHKIITLPNLAHEMLYGPRGEHTEALLEAAILPEIDRVLGPLRPALRLAGAGAQMDRIRSHTTSIMIGMVPELLGDEAYASEQAAKIEQFATAQLRALPPEEFVDLLYSAVHQDAWLLYVHGGVLGFLVGLIHLVIFGA